MTEEQQDSAPQSGELVDKDAPDAPGGIRDEMIEAIRKNARVAVITGIVMLICGILAIASPLAAGVSVTLVVGILLAIGGVSQCVIAFSAGAFRQGLLIFLMGAITALAGLFLLRQPLAGLAAITLFLAAYFIAEGVIELIAAVKIRPAQGWLWMLTSAIVTLLLGAMIWRQFPVSGAWAVGLLFGIKLVMSGWWLILVGRGVRQATDLRNA
jgi:uncharacterized membrane protein HdeD (DUF308 family)